MSKFNPRMLLIAREARSLSQAGLARALGIAQGTLSKAESGQISPSAELLERLARELRFPVAHFYREEAYKHLPFTFYRKRLNLAVTTQKAIAAEVNLLRFHLTDLMQSAELPDLPFGPVDPSEHPGGPPAIAREIRALLGIPPGPIPNLTTALENAGILVIRWDFGTAKVDGLSIFDQDEASPVILVNQNAGADRYRLTLAHELAHIVMHHQQRGLPDPETEEQAWEFAAEFMMPAAELRKQLGAKVNLGVLARLKPYWGVSMAALIHRAASLGRISERQERYLWVQMGRLGYRSTEPIELPTETPTLIGELIRYHLTTLGYSTRDLCDFLRIDEAEFQVKFRGAFRVLRQA